MVKALTMRDTFLRDYCATAFRDCDVLLVPTMPITAPRLADVDVGGGEDMPAVVLRISKNTRPIMIGLVFFEMRRTTAGISSPPPTSTSARRGAVIGMVGTNSTSQSRKAVAQ